MQKKLTIKNPFTDVAKRIHPVQFDSINCEIFKQAAERIRGGLGSSGMDAEGWRHILTSKRFGNSSDLCVPISNNMIKKLCTNKKASRPMAPFLYVDTYRLTIILSLRPIRIGEFLRCIVEKDNYVDCKR